AATPPAATPPAATPPAAAFDGHHPPDPALLADCVHCGFCLPACPTYALWADEADSPRGRIYLMAGGSQGEPMTDTMVAHFDRCLGCMACVTACPSGVRFDALIEAARAQVERRHRRPWRERALRGAVFSLFPYPRRLRAARVVLAAYQRSGLAAGLRRRGVVGRLPPALRAMEAVLPQIGPAARLPTLVPARGVARGRVGLVSGCVQSVFFSGVNAATARVLAAEGFDVVVPAGQGCCGALSAHSGREAEAVRLARALLDRFDAAGVGTVVANSAGCGSAMKDYGHLLRDDPAYAARAAALAARVVDVSELLAGHQAVAPRHPVPLRAAYHDACHLRHAQGVFAQPRRLLAAIPGLELVEVPEGDLCCGSAGVYNLVQPEAAAELGDRKAANVASTGAQVVVSANPGCSLQIAAALRRRDHPIPVVHTVEILDASIRDVPLSLSP
ncbi:MAG: (Fe-S)-binding protein, partial [Acidimicrobiales bacterium]